jgi:hypothetical protein
MVMKMLNFSNPTMPIDEWGHQVDVIGVETNKALVGKKGTVEAISNKKGRLHYLQFSD